MGSTPGDESPWDQTFSNQKEDIDPFLTLIRTRMRSISFSYVNQMVGKWFFWFANFAFVKKSIVYIVQLVVMYLVS